MSDVTGSQDSGVKDHGEGPARLEVVGRDVHSMATEKGWWDGPQPIRVQRLLDWIIEEVEEARNAYMDYGLSDWESTDADGLVKPEGMGSELADIYMIVADLALGLDFDLAGDSEKKLAYNRVRKYRRDAHGDDL